MLGVWLTDEERSVSRRLSCKSLMLNVLHRRLTDEGGIHENIFICQYAGGVDAELLFLASFFLALQKAAFCLVKCRVLHCVWWLFARRKTVFYNGLRLRCCTSGCLPSLRCCRTERSAWRRICYDGLHLYSFDLLFFIKRVLELKVIYLNYNIKFCHQIFG